MELLLKNHLNREDFFTAERAECSEFFFVFSLRTLRSPRLKIGLRPDAAQ